MSYCLGILLDDGLVFAADSRTNAGVDSVSTFRKLYVVEAKGDRVIVMLTAGNLAVTQEVVSMMERSLGTDDAERSLLRVDSMFFAAQAIGRCLRAVYDRDAEYLRAHGSEFNASLIVGGQIGDERPRMFLVYPAGNFIEAGDDTPYFQLGETKYGKPILERALTPNVSLAAAAKCALISFDSTIKSNISVAPPVDLVIYGRDTLRVAYRQRIEADDAYFESLCGYWGEALRGAFATAPDPPWGKAVEKSQWGSKPEPDRPAGRPPAAE